MTDYNQRVPDEFANPINAGTRICAVYGFPIKHSASPAMQVKLLRVLQQRERVHAPAGAFGGRVVRGQPIHGKAAQVEHDGRTIFRGLESPLVGGRYHSLIVDQELPGELERSAWMGDTVMAIRHRELPAEGVQFHPESVLTGEGKILLGNFLA